MVILIITSGLSMTKRHALKFGGPNKPGRLLLEKPYFSVGSPIRLKSMMPLLFSS